MEFIGRHNRNEIYYLDTNDSLENLPKEKWISLGIANASVDNAYFDEFIAEATNRNLIEFKASGKLAKELNSILYISLIEDYPISEIINNDSFEDLLTCLWGCFYGNIFPEAIDQTYIKVVCISFDNMNYKEALIQSVDRLNEGWNPDETNGA